MELLKGYCEIIQVFRDTGDMVIRSTLLTVFKFLYLFLTDTFYVKLKSGATNYYVALLNALCWLQKFRSSPHVCSLYTTQEKQMSNEYTQVWEYLQGRVPGRLYCGCKSSSSVLYMRQVTTYTSPL